MSGNNGPDSSGAKDPGFEDQDIAGIAGNAIAHLDGNAVAGPLWELFRFDIVAAIGRCKHCGAVRVFGRRWSTLTLRESLCAALPARACSCASWRRPHGTGSM